MQPEEMGWGWRWGWGVITGRREGAWAKKLRNRRMSRRLECTGRGFIFVYCLSGGVEEDMGKGGGRGTLWEALGGLEGTQRERLLLDSPAHSVHVR